MKKLEVKKIIFLLLATILSYNVSIAQNSSYHHVDLAIQTNQVWDAHSIPTNNNVQSDIGVIKIKDHLLIKDGSVLTINDGVRVELGHNAKITIEAGAKLDVNGATLTSATSKPWLGVEVVGNRSYPQTQDYQGVLILEASALIENAIKGVSLVELDVNMEPVWSTSGGILHAEQAQFKNCLMSIDFKPYRNLDADGTLRANVSYIKNTDFIIDDSIEEVIQNGNLIGVNIIEVDGVEISNCHFKNNVSNSEIDFNFTRGRAIVAFDSNFILKAGNLGSEEMNDEGLFLRNEIRGFDIGIDVYGAGTLTSVIIDRSNFIDNKVGVFVRNTNAALISGNKFEVPIIDSDLQAENDVSSVGLHIENSNGYIIEANAFVGPNEAVATNDDFAAGLIISSDIYTQENQVFGNQFDRLSYGLMIYGENGLKTDLGSLGLDIRYNDFGYNLEFGENTLNNKDIYVHSDATIDAVQGLVSNDVMESAGNRFKQKGVENGHIEIMNPNFSVDYYYYPSNELCIPSNSAIENIQSTINSYSFENGNRFGGAYNGPGDPPPFANPYSIHIIEELKEDYQILKDNFKEVLNGGIKAEILEILMDDLATTSDIHNKLVLGSPYLSDDVLIAAIHRNPPISQWSLTESLCLNAPLSPAVMKEFEMVQPLTPYLASLVYNKDGNSQRHILELGLKSIGEEKALTEDLYVNSLLFNEDLSDAYQKLIQLHEGDIEAYELRRLIDSYIGLRNVSELRRLLYDYQGQSDDNYFEIKSIQSQLLEEDKNWFQMSEEQVETIEQIAQQENVFGYNYAQAVLSLLNEYPVSSYSMPIAEAAQMRTHISDPRIKYNTAKRILNASPNPANIETYVSFELPERYANAFLELVNVQGQIVAKYDLGSYKHVYRIDCENYPTGAYFINLFVDDVLIETLQINIMQ